MKALFFNSTEIREDNIIWGLIEAGIDVERSELEVNLDDIYPDQVEKITEESKEYDFVITRSFSVNVAEACHISGVPYIAWCYDSPVRALYTKEAKYPGNRIFVFDKKQLKRLKDEGLDHIYHQPLAANVTKASTVAITDEEIIENECDISFIGRMYNREYYDMIAKGLPEQYDRECRSLFDRFMCNWDKGVTVFDELSDEAVSYLYGMLNKEGRDRYSLSDRFMTEYLVLVIELTCRERFKLIDEAGKRFKTIVHTFDPDQYADRISATLKEPLGYMSDELFKVYYASKINLNLTMRSIETGVPQRIFDIMSVGGCVFSNYQEEAAEMFEPDKEIVLFRSLDEFMDKADYYLRHDKERIDIGARGYMKVRDKYNYPNAIRRMISKL